MGVYRKMSYEKNLTNPGWYKVIQITETNSKDKNGIKSTKK